MRDDGFGGVRFGASADMGWWREEVIAGETRLEISIHSRLKRKV